MRVLNQNVNNLLLYTHGNSIITALESVQRISICKVLASLTAKEKQTQKMQKPCIAICI